MKNILLNTPLRSVLLAVTWLLLPVHRASAHALLDYALPKVGSVVTNPPDRIVICFTEDLKWHGSWIQVRNAKRKQVDKKDSHCDHKDWEKLYVSLPKLSSGIYQVTWHAIGADNHATDGRFNFTIKIPNTEK